MMRRLQATAERFGRCTEYYVGTRVHVEGWHPGCWFRIKEINGDEIKLETPKTKREYTVHKSKLLKMDN
jgi:hypothetical protein